MSEELKREIVFRPARGGQSVGVGFYLRGPKGVVQFVIDTKWFLPEARQEIHDRVWEDGFLFPLLPFATDLGYHSPKPMYPDQTSMGPCSLLDGQECFYDGSGYAAERVFERLIAEGDSAVWEEMEEFYRETFESEGEEG